MQYRTILVISVLCIVPAYAHAALISFDPQEKTVGTDAPFQIGINITATSSINTISLAILFPPSIEPVDVSDGNSIISLWIDHPHYDAQTHILTLSGLMPGGFMGTNGRLVTISAQARTLGTGVITVNTTESHVYLNAADTREDSLHAQTLQLRVESGKNNISNILPDTNPPEEFIPTRALLPGAHGEDAWVVVFATQDKGSGMYQYQVREVDPLFPWWGSEWHIAESPYMLEDQTQGSRIDVQAYDKNGNVRTESLPATYDSMSRATPSRIAFIIACILLVFFVVRLLKRKRI